jgi:hypothetical protein
MSLIDDKYNFLLANGLNLGQPIGPELPSVDGVGAFRVYEFGNIYWHPSLGAFEVHGAILQHYLFIGAEQSTLGYPISDELPLPDGTGRYSHFHFGIIFWTPIQGTTALANGDPRLCHILRPPPAALNTPARDLTRAEARDIVVYLVGRGELSLHANTPLRFDSNCQVVSPQPATRLVIEPPVIAGVRFTNVVGPGATVIDNVDVRMAVALYRLARFLNMTWGVTEILHKGIGHGNAAFPDDCHNTGRALDLSGLRGDLPLAQQIPGLPSQYDVDVTRDWGNQPVPVLGGPNTHTWPLDLHATTYRINPFTAPIAWALFQAVYNFAAGEFADTSEQRFGNGQPTQIGASSRFIIHPDHPGPGDRAQHQDHMHMQVATTGLEVAPP